MAPTLSFFKQPKVHSHDKAPPTSPLMPNVFVVPPEEDQSPPWCYFDAAQVSPLKSVLSTPPDIAFLNGALGALHPEPHPPVFHRYSHETIMPMKSKETRSITDVLMNSELHFTDDGADELELQSAPDVVAGKRDKLADDSVVVEVVKLRQHELEHVTIPPAKPLKSLKSRASKAFRSLKDVGKGSVRSRLNLLGTSIPMPVTGVELPSRDGIPAVPRRSSVVLSQLFAYPATLKSRTSVSSFENQGSQRDSPVSTLEQRIPGFISSTSYKHTPSSPSSSIPDVLGSLSSSPCQDSVHDELTRSPSPTSVQTFSTRRRFSILSLQRLFSFSPCDHDGGMSGSGAATPTSMSMSRNSSGPSATSSLGPDTPREGVSPISFRLEGDDKHFLDHRSPSFGSDDLSVEMRLDSLHFESLSFDASRF